MMTMYEKVANALLSAGYLTDSDVEAAIIVLNDALIIDAAEAAEEAATEDYVAQKDLIAKAEVWANEDIAVDNYVSAEIDLEIIDEATKQALADKETVVAAEAVIAAAYTDAAAALLAAELIDEVNMEASATVISETWVVVEA